eukprot:scaffold1318_cov362-Pavlova_lutheri.AAC.19
MEPGPDSCAPERLRLRFPPGAEATVRRGVSLGSEMPPFWDWVPALLPSPAIEKGGILRRRCLRPFRGGGWFGSLSHRHLGSIWCGWIPCGSLRHVPFPSILEMGWDVA